MKSGTDNPQSLVTEACVNPEHPSLAGHFPGNPLVPGLVLLDEVLTAIQQRQPTFVPAILPAVKFLSPLRPGERFSIRLEPLAAGIEAGFRFECFTADRLLAKGSILGREAGAVSP